MAWPSPPSFEDYGQPENNRWSEHADDQTHCITFNLTHRFWMIFPDDDDDDFTFPARQLMVIVRVLGTVSSRHSSEGSAQDTVSSTSSQGLLVFSANTNCCDLSPFYTLSYITVPAELSESQEHIFPHLLWAWRIAKQQISATFQWSMEGLVNTEVLCGCSKGVIPVRLNIFVFQHAEL